MTFDESERSETDIWDTQSASSRADWAWALRVDPAGVRTP